MSITHCQEIFLQLKAVANWKDRLQERVWGASHDLSEDAMDIDDRVDDTIRYRAWDQLHSITDLNIAYYAVVD